MGKIEQFTDLEVWKNAHAFVLEVYRVTGGYPKTEMYGLTSQFRRAAVSVAANIAEGFKKRGLADKMRFLNISQGSLEECHYYIILSRDLDYLENTKKLQNMLDKVARQLTASITALKNKKNSTTYNLPPPTYHLPPTPYKKEKK
jgi:four helix bundle protein